MYGIDVEPIPPRNRNNREVHLDYLKHLKESVETLSEIVEEARVEKPLDSSLESACLYTKRSQELLEYVIGTCPKDFNKRDKKIATTPLTRKKQVTFKETSGTSNANTQKHVKPQKEKNTNVHVIPSTGVTSSTEASGSKPKSNTKNNRILPAKSVNKKKVEDHPRNNKSNLKQMNRVDSSISYKCTVVQIVLWYLDSGCSKHMTGNRLCLMNFVKKFTGIVRFGNDHFGAIMGYGDYVIGDSVISRVYYMEGLGHNLFFIGQFCDSDLEVAFRKHSCYIISKNGMDLLKGSRGLNLYTVSVEDMMKSSPICLLLKASKNKSWLWHHRLNHLKFSTINDLARKDLSINGKKYILVIVDDYSRFTWVKFLRSKDETPEFVIKFLKQIQHFSPKICFENSSAERRCQKTESNSCRSCSNNTDIFKSSDVSMGRRFFGALCYPTNDNEDLRKLKAIADIGIFVGYAPNRKGYRIYNKRTRRIMETIHVQFDELTEPMAPVHISTGPEPILLTPRQINSGLIHDPVPAAPYIAPLASAVQVPIVSTGTPSSITIDQGAPSTSHSMSSSVVQPPISYQGVAVGPTIKDNSFAQADNDPFVNVFAPEPSSDESSSGMLDHLLDNVIGNPSRLVSTKKQLAIDALWCLYNSVMSKVKPKNVKTAMDEACWFEAIQEEIHKFDRLQVWELVPRPDRVMIIDLKWIYKVKLDEYGDVLKNKAQLVAKGY
ncbi:retrovirus-related pol polyprotein from transposon TNT 1-94 [Tanacetum coccineum]